MHKLEHAVAESKNIDEKFQEKCKLFYYLVCEEKYNEADKLACDLSKMWYQEYQVVGISRVIYNKISRLLYVLQVVSKNAFDECISLQSPHDFIAVALKKYRQNSPIEEKRRLLRICLGGYKALILNAEIKPAYILLNEVYEDFIYLVPSAYHELIKFTLNTLWGKFNDRKFLYPWERRIDQLIKYYDDLAKSEEDPIEKDRLRDVWRNYVSQAIVIAHSSVRTLRLPSLLEKAKEQLAQNLIWTQGLEYLANAILLFPQEAKVAFNWAQSLPSADRNKESVKYLIWNYHQITGDEKYTLIHKLDDKIRIADFESNTAYRILLTVIIEDKNTAAYKKNLIEKLIIHFKKDIFRTSPEDSTLAILTSRIVALKKLYVYFKYWSKFERSLNHIPQPKTINNGVVFFVNTSSLTHASLSIGILIEAKKKGIVVLPTGQRDFITSDSSDPELNSIAYQRGYDQLNVANKHLYEWFYQWRIDWDKRSIEAQGMNIFQPVFENVARYQFSFHVDYQNDSFTRNMVMRQITILDRAIFHASMIHNWAKKKKTEVRFLSATPHYPPAAGYRIYCENHGYKDNLEFVCVSAGYDNYFKNIGDGKSETVTCLNLTRHRNCRTSFFGTKKGFTRWWKKNKCDIEFLRSKSDNWLNMRRSKHTMDVSNPLKKHVLEIISEYKSRNRPVYVACGKLIYDLAVFYMQSKSHRDISDWITHTVEIVKSKDILLLVKPHPLEFYKEITMIEEPVQIFFDLIRTDIPENAILLDHSMFQNFELAKVVDLALFWNGTSALEYGAMGCKTVVCDDWGHNDHPVGHYQPNSRAHYEYILSNPNKVSVVRNFHSKCISFLAYMGSWDVIKPNKYAKASSVNFHQFKRAKINSEALKQLTEGEDQGMAELFKLFEFSLSKNWFARLKYRILVQSWIRRRGKGPLNFRRRKMVMNKGVFHDV